MCYFYIWCKVWDVGVLLNEISQSFERVWFHFCKGQKQPSLSCVRQPLPPRGGDLKTTEKSLLDCWKRSMYWSGDVIPWMCTHVKAHLVEHLRFVAFSACKQVFKRMIWQTRLFFESFCLLPQVKTASRPHEQLQHADRVVTEIMTWAISRFCWGHFKGSYGSITQNSNLKRNSSTMSVESKYSIIFIILWFWPPPDYFWPQGQFKWDNL